MSTFMKVSHYYAYFPGWPGKKGGKWQNGGKKVNFETLQQTLDCGQCFRWEHRPDGSWEGVAGGRFLRLTKENFPRLPGDPFWSRYFDLGTDYDEIRKGFCRLDPVLADAVHFAPDIRILNQDPWEALCSFLLSQCNNIRRIRGIIRRLCTAFGKPARGGGRAFPSPKALAEADERDLRALGCGFRAPYVQNAAREVASGALDFSSLRRLPLSEARARLTDLRGVGPKVADCTLLYGLHRLDAFPADVWIKRAMSTLFPGKRSEWFGPYAGVAQQALFYYSRSHPEIFRKKNNAR